MDLDNPGGSFFKLNPDVLAYDLRLGNINAIGRFAAAPGGNRELLRLSHGRNISAGVVRLMLGDGALNSAENAVALNNIQHLSIAHLHVEGLNQSVLNCDSTQDAGSGLGGGDVRHVQIGGVTGTDLLSKAFWRSEMGAGFEISDVHVAGVNFFSDGQLYNASGTTVLDGPCSISGRLLKTTPTTVPPTTNLPAATLLAVDLAVGDNQMTNVGATGLEIGTLPLLSKGSNANGSWVRIGDWQECIMPVTLDLSVVTQQSFVMPQPFLSVPGVSVSLSGLSTVDDKYKALARVGVGANTTNVRMRADTVVAGETAVAVIVKASGPWR